MKILVLGASGMLGNAMLRILAASPGLDVFGTSRSSSIRQLFPSALGERIISGIDVENADSLARVFSDCRPQVVINSIGVVKQLTGANDPLAALPINAILPHRLALLCALGGARLVHFSTDCVFSGDRGGYREEDASDATDLYGKSKYLGEVDGPHAITLRTSLIGHELVTNYSLMGWFLSQSGPIKGYSRVIFSGLPTVELARIVRDVILPRPDLSGIYHVASSPISKLELLRLVAKIYGKTADITPDDTLVLDRSLNAERFRLATGYVAPTWPELVSRMFAFK